jgi:5-methylcytosine-specific restriction enzyme A
MSLSASLDIILYEYPEAISTPFAGNSMAEFLRSDFPQAITSVVGPNARYIIEGSPGQGNWARVPWAAVFDRFITDTAQQGYYVVFLFKEDYSGVYLSLNQGITIIRQKYGADAKLALKVRAADFAAQLGSLKTGWSQGPIDLAISSKSNLAAYYEQGSICSKYYPTNSLPDDQVLNQDLLDALEMYLALVIKETIPQNSNYQEDDEENLEYENILSMREHKRIDRNPKLASKAKQIHGYTCQICGTNFTTVYGELGKNYIEAHHLTPLSVLKSKSTTSKVSLNPKTDFCVLCANCHRMIHRSGLFDDLVTFKKLHYKL